VPVPSDGPPVLPLQSAVRTRTTASKRACPGKELSPSKPWREAADYLLYACIPLRYSTVSGELLSHFSRGMLRKTHSMGIRGRNGFPVSRDVHVGSAQLDQNGLLDPADLLRQPLEEKGLRLGRPGG